MIVKRRAALTGITLLCAVLGFAVDIFHLDWGSSVPDFGIQRRISLWLEGNGLRGWFSSWTMIRINLLRWFLGFCCGVAIGAVLKKRSTIPAIGFAVGFLGWRMAIDFHLIYTQQLQAIAGSAVFAMTGVVWDFISIPIVLLGTTLVPGVRTLLQEPWRVRLSVRGLLLTTLFGALLLATLGYGGLLATPVGLLVMLSALAWVAVQKAYGDLELC